jgi:hypothetical protein
MTNFPNVLTMWLDCARNQRNHQFPFALKQTGSNTRFVHVENLFQGFACDGALVPEKKDIFQVSWFWEVLDGAGWPFGLVLRLMALYWPY